MLFTLGVVTTASRAPIRVPESPEITVNVDLVKVRDRPPAGRQLVQFGGRRLILQVYQDRVGRKRGGAKLIRGDAAKVPVTRRLAAPTDADEPPRAIFGHQTITQARPFGGVAGEPSGVWEMADKQVADARQVTERELKVDRRVEPVIGCPHRGLAQEPHLGKGAAEKNQIDGRRSQN